MIRKGIVAAAAIALTLPAALQAADHLDGPMATAETAADITDFYAFVSPADPNKMTFIMAVAPLATADSSFSDAVDYKFHITNAAGVMLPISCTFDAEGAYTCAGPAGSQASGQVNGEAAAGESMTVWAGLRDDPFFFDLEAFQQVTGAAPDNEAFCLLDPERDTGADFFAGLNVLAIVVEADSALFHQNAEDKLLKVWASTTRMGDR